jgi:hypothetical protein
MSEAGLLFIQVSRQRHMRRGVSLAVGWLYFFADAYPRPKKGGESSPKKEKKKINLKKKVARFFFFFFFFRWPPSRNLTNRKLNYSSFLVLSLAVGGGIFIHTKKPAKGPGPLVTYKQQQKKNNKKKSPVLSLCLTFHHSTTKQQNKTKQNNPKKSGDFWGSAIFRSVFGVVFICWAVTNQMRLVHTLFLIFFQGR